jgi:mannose-6-phosphate isomerase-like protein (cupin superfamily)
MTLNLQHWNKAVDGELTESAMRETLEKQGYTVSRYVYPPGTYFPDHTHEEDKIDAVLSGQFMMRLEGEMVILEAGDSLAVPRGEKLDILTTITPCATQLLLPHINAKPWSILPTRLGVLSMLVV